MDIELRHSGIRMLLEAIWEAAMKVVGHLLLAIDRKRRLAKAIRPQIVDSAEVVVVMMSHQQGVEVAVMIVEHLLAEVRATIYEDVGAVDFDESRCAHAAVARIAGAAGGAIATQLRNAGGCACAKECQFHGYI